MIDGFKVVVNQYLAGSKKAVKLNGTIAVSPAMWDLMKNADQAELERLLAAIPLIDLGDFNPFEMPPIVYQPLPK